MSANLANLGGNILEKAALDKNSSRNDSLIPDTGKKIDNKYEEDDMITQYPVEMLHTFDNYDLEESMKMTDNKVDDKKNKTTFNSNTKMVESRDECDEDTLNSNSQPQTKDSTSSKYITTSIKSPTTNSSDNSNNDDNSRFKKYDWNQLPIHGNSCLIKTSKYNIINIEIDNQIKQFKYNPKINTNLTLMNIFYTFNKETESVDALLNSKERLKQFAKLLIEALNIASHQSTNSTKTLLNMSIPPGRSSILSTYSKEASDFLSSDFSETGTIIHLWYLQLTKFLLQKDSLFFSNDALQNILKKKYNFDDCFKVNNNNKNTNSLTAGQNNDLNLNLNDLKNTNNSKNDSRNDSNNNFNNFNNSVNILNDVDVLVIRPSFASLVSWQLATDEPTLNFIDFQLNPAPLDTLMKESKPDIMVDRLGRVVKELSSLSTVCNEDELQELDNSNINQYLLDCMGRPITPLKLENSDNFEASKDPSVEIMKPDINITSTTDNSGTNNNNDDDGSVKYSNENNEHVPPFLSDDKDSKKKTSNKKSSIMKFFRRKHPSNNSWTNLSQSYKKPIVDNITPLSNIGSTGSSGSTSTGSVLSSGKTSNRSSASPILSKKNQTSRTLLNENLTSYDNSFLEDYFVNELNNLKTISMTTQYYLPNQTGIPQSQEMVNSNSVASNDSFSSNENNFIANNHTTSSKNSDANSNNYNREYIRLKLPFKDNSIPVIYSPWVWGHLNRRRWNSMAKEMFRILKPEGYILAFQNDLIPSNYSVEPDKIFPTTMTTNALYNSVIMDVINQKFYIHPTKHLPNIFKQHGFTNIKSSTLTLKLGDLKTEMGCLNQFVALMDLNFVFRHGFSNEDDGDGDNNSTNVGDILQNYIDEHWGNIDDSSGTTRIVYIVAQKPKKK